MSKTRAELVIRAADNLLHLGAGQTLSDEDYAKIDECIDSLARELAVREIVHFSPDSIENEFFLPLAILLADAAKEPFGGAKLDVAAAEMKLRRMTRAGTTHETLRTVYY